MSEYLRLLKKDVRELIPRMRDDPFLFVEGLWHEWGNDKKMPLTWLEEDAIRYTFDRKGPRFRGIKAFRRCGKTSWGTIPLPLYRWFCGDLNRCIIVISKSADEAKKTAYAIRSALDSIWFLKHLAPVPGQRDNIMLFDVNGRTSLSRQPSLQVIGVGGHMEGNRAHTIVIDDVETKSNTQSVTARDKLFTLCTEFTHIAFKDEDESQSGESEVIVMGTVKHEDSLYTKLERGGYKFRTYPAAYPPNDIRIHDLAPCIESRRGQHAVWEPTAPHNRDAHEISQAKALSYREFLKEWMCVVDFGGTLRHPLKLANLIVVDSIHRDFGITQFMWGTENSKGSTRIADIELLGFDGDYLHRPAVIGDQTAPFWRTHCYIDPAFGGHDKTGAAFGSNLGANIQVKGVYGLDGGTTDLALDRIANLCREHGVQYVYCEQNAGHGLYDKVLWPHLQRLFVEPGQHPKFPLGWKCQIVDDPKVTKAGIQKERRIIETLEPALSQHRLIAARSVVERDPGEDIENALQFQISRITPERDSLPEDGKIDALAGLIKSLDSNLDLDPTSLYNGSTTPVDPLEQAGQEIARIVGSRRALRSEAGWERLLGL